MTDSEIIKALENSINTYNEKGVYVDTENLQQQVLDLLKRQKKELEAIKDKRAIVFKLSDEQINEVKEHILKSVDDNERKIKAEAYKEFAERLKSYLLLNKKGEMSVISFENVDTLLKEMVGEEE